MFGLRVFEDVVCGLGPGEGFAPVVPSVDEPADGGDEIADRAERSTADGLPGDDPEEHLDEVEQDPDVGVKCSCIRGLRASHAFTFGCLWVP